MAAKGDARCGNTESGPVRADQKNPTTKTGVADNATVRETGWESQGARKREAASDDEGVVVRKNGQGSAVDNDLLRAALETHRAPFNPCLAEQERRLGYALLRAAHAQGLSSSGAPPVTALRPAF